jgi:hypothetical protein
MTFGDISDNTRDNSSGSKRPRDDPLFDEDEPDFEYTKRPAGTSDKVAPRFESFAFFFVDDSNGGPGESVRRAHHIDLTQLEGADGRDDGAMREIGNTAFDAALYYGPFFDCVALFDDGRGAQYDLPLADLHRALPDLANKLALQDFQHLHAPGTEKKFVSCWLDCGTQLICCPEDFQPTD